MNVERIRALEFPANFYPWVGKAKLRVIKNKDCKILVSDYEKAIDDNTIIVPLSHVAYGNGFKDLRAGSELPHKHNSLVLVDGIQSLGALELNSKKCDKESACFT